MASSLLDLGVTAICSVRLDSGPFAYQNFKPDRDGEGIFLATTETLIYTLIARRGTTGSAVIGDITFGPNATRNTLPPIRDDAHLGC